MPIIVETREGPCHVSDVAIHAIWDHGERFAEMAVATLQATGLFPADEKGRPGWSNLPLGFIYEFGIAVVQLGLWERQGIRHHLDPDLPTHQEAAKHLTERARKGFREFQGPKARPLSDHVLRVWHDRCAWNGWQEFRADIAVSEIDEDEFVDQVANFLWNYHSLLSGSAETEDGTE